MINESPKSECMCDHDHDWEPVPERCQTKTHILNSIGIDAKFTSYFDDFPDIFYIVVCLKCKTFVDEITEFKNKAETIIEENNLFEKCKSLRRKRAQELFFIHFNGG